MLENKSMYLSAHFVDFADRYDHKNAIDPTAFNFAVNSFLVGVLGRRPICLTDSYGIFPLIKTTAEELQINYKDWVTLYQPENCRDELMEFDPDLFGNVVYVKTHGNDGKGIMDTKEQLFNEVELSHAVFIGGDKNTHNEYLKLKAIQESVRIIPVNSTGGVTSEIAALEETDANIFRDNIEYLFKFYDLLDISPKEQRFETRSQQIAES